MSRLPTPPVLQRPLQNPRSLAGAYKLADGLMAGNFGLDVALGESEIDQGRMAARILYADGNRRDGVGDLLEVSGIQLWRHRANPCCLFDHGKQVQLPIGTCEDPETKAYRNEIDPLAKTAAAWCFFYGGKGLNDVAAADEYEHATYCEQLFDMVVKRILRGGSIGYQNIKTLPLQADYQTGTPPGQHLLVTLMLEFSLVVLPANGDTVMKGFPTVDAYNEWEESVRRNLSRGYLVCGKALSPVLHKSLASCVPAETKTVSGYEGKSASDAERLLVSIYQNERNLTPERLTQSKIAEYAEGFRERNTSDDDIRRLIADAWQLTQNARIGGKNIVAVPLANIPNTKIPPAKFNPGVGAVCGCDKKKLKTLRGKYGREKYMGVDQEQTATGIRCTPAGKIRVGAKAQPFHFGKGWTAVARKSLGVKGYELRRVRRDRDGLEGWVVFNTVTGRPDSDEIYWNESDARRHLADALESERMGGGYDDPDPGRGVRRKSIQVKYRNKLVKGVPNVSMKFDTSGMSAEQQNAFCKAMAEAGFGKPKGLGGRWSDGEKTQLTSPMKAATFAFDMDPATANISDAVGKAVTIASQHGAKFLGSQKSTQPQGAKAMPATIQVKSAAELIQAYANGHPSQWNIDQLVGQISILSGKEAQEVWQAMGMQGPTSKDKIAQRFKERWGSWNHTANIMRKDAGKNMKAKKKAMPGTDVDAMAADLAGADAVAVATDEMATVEGDVLAAEEKMGAQVLRRLHEIHSALLEEGDEMLELLENEGVRSLLEGKLQDVADTITECEELFSGEGYGSLNGEIEDKSEDGVDEEEEPTDADGDLEQALPDDSSSDEEEPVEDAVAGMATKELRAKYLKALRKHYGKKQPAAKTKALTEDEAVAIASDIESQTEDVEEKALEPHEKKAVGSAAAYLKDITGDLLDGWGDNHRKDAYFHHKTLEPIGSQMEDPTKVDAIGQGVEMATDGGGAVKGICPGCGKEPCVCAEKSIDGVQDTHLETDTTAQIADLSTEGMKMCGRKAVGAASQFLKELSDTAEFTDDHRQKSMGWHKDLSGMAEAEEVGADASDADAAQVAPPEGDVQTKTALPAVDTKALKQSAQQDQQALEEAARKLDRLAKLFG